MSQTPAADNVSATHAACIVTRACVAMFIVCATCQWKLFVNIFAHVKSTSRSDLCLRCTLFTRNRWASRVRIGLSSIPYSTVKDWFVSLRVYVYALFLALSVFLSVQLLITDQRSLCKWHSYNSIRALFFSNRVVNVWHSASWSYCII